MDIITQQDIANLAQEEKYRAQVEVMRKIATATGFYEYFFSVLSIFPTRSEAFNYVNDLYYELFGEYRYTSYNSFLDSNRKRYEKR